MFYCGFVISFDSLKFIKNIFKTLCAMSAFGREKNGSFASRRVNYWLEKVAGVRLNNKY